MVKNNTLQFCCNNHIKYINRVSNMLSNGKCTTMVVTTILYRTDIYITYKNTSKRCKEVIQETKIASPERKRAPKKS